jgi:hypothetical protein
MTNKEFAQQLLKDLVVTDEGLTTFDTQTVINRLDNATADRKSISLDRKLELIREMGNLIDGNSLFEDNRATNEMIKDTLKQIEAAIKAKEANK